MAKRIRKFPISGKSSKKLLEEASLFDHSTVCNFLCLQPVVWILWCWKCKEKCGACIDHAGEILAEHAIAEECDGVVRVKFVGMRMLFSGVYLE